MRIPLGSWSFLATLLLVAVPDSPCLSADRHSEGERVPKVAHLHPYCRNGKWGYLDKQGETRIEPRFDYAGQFSEGLAPARSGKNGGYVRPDGTWQFELPDHIASDRSFREGRVAFRERGKFGFLDREGNVVVPAAYDHVFDFRDGGARVLTGYGRPVGGDEPPRGEWSFIDREGKPAVAPTPNPASQQGSVVSVGEFSEGLLAVNRSVVENQAAKPVAGFVDKTGKTVIASDFEWANDFSEGAAAVRKWGTFGYVDRQGAWLLCPCFDEAGEFHEGLARVRIGARWQFVDRRGCLISSTNRDLAGRPVAASPWNDAGSFEGGVALVHVGGERNCDVPHQPCPWEKGAWYYVNQRGTVIALAWRDEDGTP